MALNIKPFFPRAQIILVPTPKAPDSMDANTKTDPGPEGSCSLRTNNSPRDSQDKKEKLKRRLWVWGIY